MISCAGLLLVGIGYGVVRSVQKQQAQTLQHMRLNPMSEVDQRIQNFRRVSIREGKKVWEIAAREARYFEAESIVIVYGPEVAFYLGEGEIVSVRGEEGRLRLRGQEVERIVLKGKLKVRLAGLLIVTEEAVYSEDKGRIFSPGVVEITGRGLTIKGEGCEVAVADKKLTLARNVQTVIAPQLNKASGQPPAGRPPAGRPPADSGLVPHPG
jgi:LPS export ABC transporter protein LptC